MGQLLYEVSRKYHFTFSFDSVLCNWVNYSHGITYVLWYAAHSDIIFDPRAITVRGAFVHKIWRVYSFIRYRHIEGVPKFRNWARTPGHAHLGANLWSVDKKSPGSMYAANLKSVASSDPQMLRGSQKFEIRHVLQATPTSGPICGPRARTAQPPCAHEIWQAWLHPTERYWGGPEIWKLGTFHRPRRLGGQFLVCGQEQPRIHVHTKFEERSFIRYRDIEGVPNFVFSLPLPCPWTD